MDKAVLLEKLRNYDDLTFELYKFYIDATSKTYNTSSDNFNTCIEDLKTLCGYQYDFNWLKLNAKQFGANRREFKSLCDDVCVLLGNSIDELVRHSRETVVVKPSNFEDYCPFPSEALVVYHTGQLEQKLQIDGSAYYIVDTKIESTPYYSVFCSSIDK